MKGHQVAAAAAAAASTLYIGKRNYRMLHVKTCFDVMESTKIQEIPIDRICFMCCFIIDKSVDNCSSSSCRSTIKFANLTFH